MQRKCDMLCASSECVPLALLGSRTHRIVCYDRPGTSLELYWDKCYGDLVRGLQ
jgi:hypothetical protein